MVTVNPKYKMNVLLLLKDFPTTHTISSLAKEINLSRVGIWKILKKLQSEQFVTLTPVGSGKTSTYIVNLNWDNVLVEKSLELYLTEEAFKQRRWKVNFAELESLVDFLILYGSVLYLPKQANDIDIICVVSDKKKFIKIQKIIDKVQKSQIKKIHTINFTKTEFKKEVKKNNRAITDAVKKGIILFGQEKFVQLIKNIIVK